MERQKAVFVNVGDCTCTMETNIILQDILSNAHIKPENSNSNVDLYCWEADTKYYSAEIRIAILKTKSLVSQEFAASVEVVLLYFNSNTEEGLAELNSWLPIVETWNPAIRLAVCDKCNNGDAQYSMNRTTALKWCLDNEFELIELNPEPEDYDEYEDTGTKRIKGAMLAHIWPEMIMKDPNQAIKTTTEHIQKDKALVENPQKHVDQLLGKDGEYDDVIGDENDQDSFEKLFSKLATVKDQVSSMPHDQRKKTAENMVRAFWTALGGDDEEFAGLSSDDEDKCKKKSDT